MRSPDKEIAIPTSIRIPKSLKKKLKAIADARRQPLTWLVILALEEWECDYVKKQDWEQRERELARINR